MLESSDVVVTTSHKPSPVQSKKARRLAYSLGFPYIPRRRLSDVSPKPRLIYVLEKDDRLVLITEAGRLFFHPSAAKIRYLNLKKGLEDHLIRALSPKGSERILDLTFGLGSEAILMAHFLPRGEIVGLEASVHIYNVVRHGIERFLHLEVKPEDAWIKEALRRVTLINANFGEYLRKLEHEAFDVVYCDPMFERPKFESSSMNPLRPVAVYDTVNEKDIAEFLRVCRHKVIIKFHKEDSRFKDLHFHWVTGSKKSGVLYGVIEKR
ncbi:MAG: class I SAM-dependent methyltransferase [Thermotogae bacterium]|nr:class I SAM-dependent methyltransferase [Thermotogota bacterium]